MAMTYVPSLKGYVTDVPEIWLKRKDNKVFHFDQLSSSNVSPDTQFTEVNAGWSMYPVAYLPGQSTMEMTFESAQFDADLFALATNTEFTKQDVEVWGSAVLEATEDDQTEFVIESEKDLTKAHFYINGFNQIGVEAGALGANTQTYEVASLEAGDSPKEKGLYVKDSNGNYVLTDDTEIQSGVEYYELKKTENSGSSTEGGTTNTETFTPTDNQKKDVNTVAGFKVLETTKDASTGVYKTRIVLKGKDGEGIAKGDQLDVSYVYTENIDTIQVDNQQTFVGEAILKWPVYASGEETKAAGVKGYMIMHIYKCRCTAMPGFDTSYKSTATNGITLSAMDSHRHDGAIYSMSYLEK